MDKEGLLFGFEVRVECESGGSEVSVVVRMLLQGRGTIWPGTTVVCAVVCRTS